MGDKVRPASFRGCSAICMRPRVEKQWENGIKQVKTALWVTAAKLNFELDRGMGD